MMGMQIFVGGPQLNAPIQQSSLPPGVRAVAEVAWHSVTIAFLYLWPIFLIIALTVGVGLRQGSRGVLLR
jgi:hypothetical protein